MGAGNVRNEWFEASPGDIRAAIRRVSGRKVVRTRPTRRKGRKKRPFTNWVLAGAALAAYLHYRHRSFTLDLVFSASEWVSAAIGRLLALA